MGSPIKCFDATYSDSLFELFHFLLGPRIFGFKI